MSAIAYILIIIIVFCLFSPPQESEGFSSRRDQARQFYRRGVRRIRKAGESNIDEITETISRRLRMLGI